MHDLIRTLDLKLYSVLPGGQIYIFFFDFFFYNQPVLITLFGKASTLVRSLSSNLHENAQNRTDDSVWIHLNRRDTKD